MKIICTKDEVAAMLTHCIENHNRTAAAGCEACPIYERCDGAYVDTLNAMVEISDPEVASK